MLRLHCRSAVGDDTQAAQQDKRQAPSLSDELTSPSGPQPNAPKQQDELPYWLVAVLGSLGALQTGYLTWTKLTEGGVVCPLGGGCSTVLSSDYATVFGIPLTLVGCLAYGSVAGLGIAGQRSGGGPALQRLTLAGGTALAATSANLLWILARKFGGEPCTWCISSAILSITIFGAALQSFNLRQLRQLALPGAGIAASVSIGLAVAWQGASSASVDFGFDLPYQPVLVRESSPSEAPALAKRLREAGAKMYGAFWCTHCHDQKEEFGREAMSDFPYVECYPDGVKNGTGVAKECIDADVKAFPTWIINGQHIEGQQTFAALEAALK
ncbi:hypothetical protein WJX84_007719 [Apatococcus fuscideae]|uniref:Vitamin K epoxide reductase domain-containing protein n=1 Tax=Apatococcus fuscideae TaxID=2026836 RepID=A0AAW1TAN4_9CHLO